MLPDEYDARKKGYPLWDYMFRYFPDTFLAEVEVAVAGNKQHANDESKGIYWAREKSTDQLNTAMRHQFDYGMGRKKDTDGQWHLAKAIWRLRAQLQLDIEAERSGGAGAIPCPAPTSVASKQRTPFKPYRLPGRNGSNYGWVAIAEHPGGNFTSCACGTYSVTDYTAWADLSGLLHTPKQCCETLAD